MSLEEFVMFLEDSSLLRTHTPHDENDQAFAEYKALLDPIQLLTMLPRGLIVDPLSPAAKKGGKGTTPKPNAGDGITRRLSVVSKVDQSMDVFTINFTQFYELLLRMTEIVYPTLWKEDKTVALNKVVLVRQIAIFRNDFLLICPLGKYLAVICVDVRSCQDRFG